MPYFDPEIMGGFIGGAMEHTDAILQGARTWKVMADAWPTRTGDDDPFTDWMNNVQKYVVSRLPDRRRRGEVVHPRPSSGATSSCRR